MLQAKARMTDKITLGGIGYLLAGITVFVTVMGAMVAGKRHMTLGACRRGWACIGDAGHR